MATVSGDLSYFYDFHISTHSETISEILQFCVTSRKTESHTLTYTGMTGGDTFSSQHLVNNVNELVRRDLLWI